MAPGKGEIKMMTEDKYKEWERQQLQNAYDQWLQDELNEIMEEYRYECGMLSRAVH